MDTERMVRSRCPELAFIHLERALLRDRCPVCRVTRETEEQSIWILLYEHGTDPVLRGMFDSNLGFCQHHGYLAMRVAEEREVVSGQTIGLMYETTVTAYRRMLGQLSKTQRMVKVSRRSKNLVAKLAPQECLMCQTRRETTQREISSLVRMLGYPEYRSAYTRSEGLCNPHFALTILEADRETRRFLLEDQRQRMEELQRRLSEAQRKRSYDVHESATPEEQNSWREAVWRFTGVCGNKLLIERRP